MSTRDDNDNATENSRPIEAIRNIIFGEQEKTFAKKFTKLEQLLEKQSTDVSQRLDRLDTQIEELSQQLLHFQKDVEKNESSLEKKIDLVRAELKKNRDELDQTKVNRLNLAEQLETIVNSLKNNK